MSDRLLRILVITALALNIFAICAVAGGGIAWTLISRKQPERQLPLAAEALPSEQRTAFQRALAEARRTVRDKARDSQQAKSEAAVLIGQPVVDTQALRAALARARADDELVRQTVEERATTFVAELPVDERRALSERLLQRLAPKTAPAQK